MKDYPLWVVLFILFIIMTREEEIKQYCESQGFPYGACSGISSINAQVATDAIKWADKTIVNKACEWLKENIDLYSYNAFNTKSCYTEIKLTDEFETAFRQAMEGGAE